MVLLGICFALYVLVSGGVIFYLVSKLPKKEKEEVLADILMSEVKFGIDEKVYNKAFGHNKAAGGNPTTYGVEMKPNETHLFTHGKKKNFPVVPEQSQDN